MTDSEPKANLPPDEEAIFAAATKLSVEGERGEFLRRECGDDVGMIGRVGARLAELEDMPTNLMEGGAAGSTWIRSANAGPGSWKPPEPEEIDPLFPPYKITKLLGSGLMGAVYKGIQLKLNRQVAIKVLPPELIEGDPTFESRFEREARAMAQLDHPNIVTIYELGCTEEGHYYIAMEYVDGMDFHQLIQKAEIRPEETLNAVSQICDALEYAHGRGYVHRDIKPANIFVSREGIVKVGDFGLAKVFRDGIDLAGSEDPMLTQPGRAWGTPAYCAPEQMDGQHVDHRADIYSLGVTFYQMLTGSLPRGNFPLPSQKVQVDVRVDEIVLRAMESEPEMRYSSVRDMKTDVETARTPPSVVPQAIPQIPAAPSTQPSPIATRSAPAAASAAARPAERQKGGLKQWMLVGGLPLGLVILVTLGIWLSGKGEDEAPLGRVPPDLETPFEVTPPGMPPVENPPSEVPAVPLRWDMELRNHIDSVVPDGWDSHLGRGMYGKAAHAMEEKVPTSWLIGWGLTRNGMAHLLRVDESGRFSSRDLTPEEAKKLGVEERSYARFGSEEFALPSFELVMLSDPELRYERRDGKPVLVGSVELEPLNQTIEIREAMLQVAIEFEEGEQNGTLDVPYYLKVDRLPEGKIDFVFDLDFFFKKGEMKMSLDRQVSLWVEAFTIMGNPMMYRLSKKIPVMIESESLETAKQVAVPELRWDTELRNFLDRLLVRGWDSSVGRQLYGDIVVAMDSGYETTFVVGDGFTKDERAYGIMVDKNGRWTTGSLSSTEAREKGVQAKTSARTTDGWVFSVPGFEVSKLSDADLRIEEHEGDRFSLVGTLQCTPYADVELRDLKIVAEVEMFDDENGEGTTTFMHYVRAETLPSGKIEVEYEIDVKKGKRYHFERGITLRIEAFALMGNPRNLRLSNKLTANVDMGSYPAAAR